MRDREQRLRWIEKLIGGGHQDAKKASALVVPTAAGGLAIPFESVVEVVAAARVQPLAFLPEEFCGVLHRGIDLVPVVDANGSGIEKAAHVVVAQGGGCLMGLRFAGTPSVVDLDEVDHEVLETRFYRELDPDVMPVLDVEAAVKALLEQD